MPAGKYDTRYLVGETRSLRGRCRCMCIMKPSVIIVLILGQKNVPGRHDTKKLRKYVYL